MGMGDVPATGFEAFLHDIKRTGSISTLWSLTADHFQATGFDAVGYLLFDRGKLDHSVALLERGFPDAVVQKFAEMGYGRNAPLIRFAMSTGQPQIDDDMAGRFRMTASERTHRAAIIEAGLSRTLALPLFGPQGRSAIGFLALARDPGLYRGNHVHLLHMAAQAAHLRACNIQARQRATLHNLSDREVEVLRWVAQGKSNSVIADITGIAPATVDTYLRRAFEKLDVTDRTAAAVKGVMLGIIRV